MTQTNQPLDHPIMLFDGTAVSNPGAAAGAAILLLPNGRRYTVSQFISFATASVAQYTGLIIGLKKAKQLGLKTLEIKGDSEVVFNQVNGLTPVQDKNTYELHMEAQQLMNSFDKVSLECIPKEQNRSAVAAVNRCIGEALGIETKNNHASGITVHPGVVRLLQLNEQATEKDFRKLAPPLDEFVLKPLSELRDLVPEAVRDVIGLRWDGDEQHLAEIYRWYLRGLTPDMALRKVAIDKPKSPKTQDKLPWEDGLISQGKESDIESSAPFVTDPILGLLDASPPNPNPIPINERETLLSIPREGIPPAASEPPKTINKIPPVDKTDLGLDTLPSMVKVNGLMEQLTSLSDEERELLTQQLILSPEWVGLLLRSIADYMANVKR
ncbi:MAG: hypothetical protein N5P05_003298 [Chroococcopsis gigantea SAG 12.99]|jgi:ribonuclease HI|nr:ribonuclease HI family protein [Chlorogloea purpurea SAG 13.99]MDV3001692.1 hypothetical protein [Chroococcopsis gigantea SAG 12.99]